MAGTQFDVSILLRLIDQITGPGKRAAANFRGVSQSISQSAAAMRSASTGAAAGVAAIGTSAQRAQRQVSGFMGTMRKMGAETRRGGMVAGDGGFMRTVGGYLALKNIINATEETAKAENRFRGLVNDATPEGVMAIRKTLFERMNRSGETYAELINAAGDAAQIMQSSKIAADIAVSASKLRNIDTDGKDVTFFAENLAALLGKDGTVAQLGKLGDMLAMQQKLGAATAGGTVDAFRNFQYLQNTAKFSTADALTAIGLIKNASPALQNSRIGVAGQYAIRMLNSPNNADLKALRGAGLSPKSFETDGAFDIAKAQRIFYEMTRTTEGLAKFKKMFAGRNVQARLFWENLLGVSPEEFRKYRQELTGGIDELNAADKIRFEGIVGALNAIRASAVRLSLAFGELLTPALIAVSNIVAPLITSVGILTSSFAQSHPMLSGAVAGWLGLVGVLGMLGIVSSRALGFSRLLLGLPFSVLGGAASGIMQAVVAIGAMGTAAFRAGGAMGALRFGLMALIKFSAIGAAITGIIVFWDQLAAVASGFWTGLSTGWEGSEIQRAFAWLGSMLPGLSGILESIKSAIASIFSIGDISSSGLAALFSGAAAAATALLNPLASIKGLVTSITSGQVGVPAAVGKKAADAAAAGAGTGVVAGPMTNNVTKNSTVNVGGVTVNVTQSNADPNAIGAAAASAVGNKVRGALSDAPASAP